MTLTAFFSPSKRELVADIVLAAFVCWVASSIYFSHPLVLEHYGVSLPYSSDNVTPYLLFDDLFRRGLPLAGWQFPEAPFWFPDVMLGWLAYGVSGSLDGAIAGYAWMSSLLFVLLARGVLLRAGSNAFAWRIWLGVWLASLACGIVASPSWFSHLYSYVFVPYIHSGCLLTVLAAAAMLLHPPARHGPAQLIALALLCALALASDRLFVLQFMLPAIALSAWIGLGDRSRWHLQAAALLTLILVGSETVRWSMASAFTTEANDRMPPITAVTGIWRDLRILIGNDPFNSALIAVGLVTLGVILSRGRRANAGSSEVHAWLQPFALFVLLAALLPLAATLVLGRYHSAEEWRYLQTLTLVPLALIAVLDAIMGRLRRVRIGAFAWSTTTVLAITLLVTLGADRKAGLAYADDQAACLAEAAHNRHLHFGLATYWHAGEMTARFPRGPLLAPLSADAGPRMRTIVDLAWIGAFATRASELPVLDFVDEDGYTSEQLDRTFGPPAARIDCPRSTYRMYRAEDGAFARWHRAADWMPSQLLSQVGRAVVPAAAWAADPRFVAGDGIHGAGQFATATPVLMTALDVAPGAVGVWFDYSLSSGPGQAAARWEVLALDDAGRPMARLGLGELKPTTDARRIDLALGTASRESHVLGITIAVEGEVNLRVAAVGLSLSR